MKSLFLLLKLTHLAVTELLRQPTYVLTTLIFPSMFFWFFGVPNAASPEAAQMLMGSFSAFAVLGVLLFQMTVIVAQERASHWSLYQRILPIPSKLTLLSQLIASFLLAILAVSCVVLTALYATDLRFPEERWPGFFAVVILGGLPFASLGLILGSITTPKSAVPVANLIYLPLSFAGGLWLPPTALAESVRRVSGSLPTRFYVELVWAVAADRDLEEKSLWGLLIYALIFLGLALILHKKDSGARFG